LVVEEREKDSANVHSAKSEVTRMNKKEHGQGNKICPSTPGRYQPEVRKVPADSVPYGESISRNGQTVWVALDGERIVCVAPSAEEARRKYRDIMLKQRMGRGGSDVQTRL
jgi:hypothetical protein